MLNCERNTREMARRVSGAAQRHFHARVEPFFEHGQWWITVRKTGAHYAVCDASGQGATDGFCFEQVTSGDGE